MLKYVYPCMYTFTPYHHNKQSILPQITSGRLDNTVQATNFINSTLSQPVHSQTVRNALKEAVLYSATKTKVLMLKQQQHQKQLKFAQYHENWTVEDWKSVLWSDETKINRIGSDRKVYICKKNKGNQYLTGLPHQLSNMEGGVTSLGLYGVECSGKACRSSGKDECRPIL